MKEQSGYYTVLTPNVRYSKKISANEKLLYAEITALTNAKGYCWASNEHFAKLFDCTPQAISKWIKNLKTNGFLTCEYTYKQGSKEVDKRLIRLLDIGINNHLGGINNGSLGINNDLGGYQQSIKDNNTSINNINNNNNNISLVGFKKPTTDNPKNILFKTKLDDVDKGSLDERSLEYFNIAIGFRNLFIKNLKSLNISNFKNQEEATYGGYVEPIRLAMEKDGWTNEDFKFVYRFLSNDEFWKKNILSTDKLRSQMDKILPKAKSFKPPKKQVLPQDWFSRELTDDQKELVKQVRGIDSLKRWEDNRSAIMLEGGRLYPVKIEYEQ